MNFELGIIASIIASWTASKQGEAGFVTKCRPRGTIVGPVIGRTPESSYLTLFRWAEGIAAVQPISMPRSQHFASTAEPIPVRFSFNLFLFLGGGEGDVTAISPLPRSFEDVVRICIP